MTVDEIKRVRPSAPATGGLPAVTSTEPTAIRIRARELTPVHRPPPAAERAVLVRSKRMILPTACLS